MPQLFVPLVLASLVLAPPGRSLTERLWEENRDLYEQILRHPFLTGLVNGNLDRKAFAFYMIQDAHYLREFARALDATAAKAPKAEWAALLSAHAADTLQYERQLHESVFKEYGISTQEVMSTEPAPEAFAYTSFLVATAFSRPFAESLGALLPCYWIYWEVGKELKKHGSTNSTYQKWIDAYSSEDYGRTVKAVLDIVNEVARSANPNEIKKIREHFRRSTRYEWMFWDSAYHRRSWAPGKVGISKRR